MKRIAWLTDIHLNFLQAAQVDAFLDRLSRVEPDAILIGGDIAEAPDVVDYLGRIGALGLPVYFVLGNHDFYFGKITQVRDQVAAFCELQENVRYLSLAAPVQLAAGIGLVGHDGWADGRIGDYERSFIMMNDYKLIAELAGLNKQTRLPLLHALGDEAAAHIRRVLPRALQSFAQVFLLTHVPPLREACWHEGRHSDDEWAPHFTCKAMGDTILEIMRDHPQQQLTVLCGHTHSGGETKPLDNVTIITGGAKYGHPDISRLFELP
jgi:predicted MPP superfamily phosphohydrolase